MHGKTDGITHDGSGLFAGLPSPLTMTRYHSLVIKKETFHNPDFIVSAWTDEGEIMLRGATVFSGYLGDPAATAKSSSWVIRVSLAARVSR